MVGIIVPLSHSLVVVLRLTSCIVQAHVTRELANGNLRRYICPLSQISWKFETIYMPLVSNFLEVTIVPLIIPSCLLDYMLSNLPVLR